jgi:uncharacterized pyridoxamine 5'-phosphate oxidase family protein
MSRVLEFLHDAQVFYIATVDGDTPKVRPFGLAFEYEGRLYFGVGDYKPSYRQLKANPKFEISAVRNGTEWIRLSAEAVFDDRAEVSEKAFEVAPNLRDAYTGEGKPRLALFYADGADATVYDMAGKVEKVEL